MDTQLKLLINAFSQSNNFILIDHNQSVGDLATQINTNQEANIVIKGKNSLNIYNGNNDFHALVRSYDPKKKIKNFINIRRDRLTSPIIVNLSKPLDANSPLSNLLGNVVGSGDNSFNVDQPGFFEILHQDLSLDNIVSSENYHIPRDVVQADPETQSRVAKPYYIVSEFEETIIADVVFNVDVFLSRRPGNKSSNPLMLQDEWQIDILIIPIAGLDLIGEHFQSIVVKEENLDKRLYFQMKARAEGKGKFLITARYKGIELFQKEYEVSVLPQTDTTKSNKNSSENLIKGRPKSMPPDLTLLITQAHDDGQLTLKYFLHSPDISLNLIYKNFTATIQQQDVGAYFLDFFKDIDSIKQETRQQRLDAVNMMKAKGAKLYKELFPEEFRRIFWNIHDKIKSIVINSDEPWIPWEMCFMYPEETGITDGIFLCESFEISRWISGSYSPITEISLANAAIIIPSDSKLLFPQAEKEGLQATFDSVNAHLTEVTASYKEVRNSFMSGNYNVWHFSGHGTDSSGTNSSHYKILLENGDALSPDDITGIKSIGKGNPIVFFNACQASKPGLGLTGLSGWPKQFIDNNVSAFIGAYWSVIDETACKLSLKFYELLAIGEPIASALKKARLYVKDDGNPTWLAYTLYADPFAKVTLENHQ